jgi:hypothetical protein
MTPRTQKITSILSGGCDFCGNQVRIDAGRIRLYFYDRCRVPAKPKEPSASSRARPLAAGRSTLRCSRADGAGLFHIAASGLSLPRTSSAAKTPGPARRSQTGLHGEASSQPRSARAHFCCGQRIVHQRGSQPSVARAAAARARAWVSRNQFGHEPCSWNIDSIVCCQTNLLTCTTCSCQTDASQSEEKLRNKRIPPQE